MTVPITPEILAAAWDYICTTPPLCDWNLPASDDITFRVIKTRKVFGQISMRRKRYVIEVSESRCGRHDVILSTLCHEAAHLHTHSACFMNPRNVHDAAFWALADQICDVHEFDRKNF